MDFQIYDCAGNEILVNEVVPVEKNNWNLPSDGSMDNQEYFNWTEDLKVDEGKLDGGKNGRKRKLNAEVAKLRNDNFKLLKNGEENEEDVPKATTIRRTQNGEFSLRHRHL